MVKNSQKSIADGVLSTLQRFPIPSLFSLLFCIISILSMTDNSYKPILLFSLFLGFFWFIALKLFAESNKWKTWFYYAVGIPVFMGLVWHINNSFSIRVFSSFFLLASAIFLSICIAPFLKPKASSMQMWMYNLRLWTRILFTIFAAILLFLGLAMIIASVEFLFKIDFYKDIYFDVWVIVATLFSPFLAMSGIPIGFDAKQERFPQALQFILSYIALPLLCVYMVIVYAYAAKILIVLSLPQGGVVQLVSAFACSGIVAYLVSYPLIKSPGVAGLFVRHFFKLLLLPIVLLAVGIGVRIHEYGITEDRYAVLLCLIWLSGSVFFGLFRNKEQAPKFIIVSIVGLMIVSSFGPWGIVSVSTRSQINRLENLLEKNSILVNGRIEVPHKKLDRRDSAAISEIMDYIVSTNKGRHLEQWFVDLPTVRYGKKWEELSAKEILQSMGVEYVETDHGLRSKRQKGIAS